MCISCPDGSEDNGPTTARRRSARDASRLGSCGDRGAEGVFVRTRKARGEQVSACLTAAELSAYLMGDSTFAGHVIYCSRCSAISAAVKPFVDADATTLRGVIAEIEQRSAEAESAVATLEKAFPGQWESVAKTDSRLQSPEAIRRLLTRASEIRFTTQRRSLALAQIAATLCDITPDIPVDLRVLAAKDVSVYLLRAADDINGALQSLANIDACIATTSDPAYFLAVVAHTRAYIYGDDTCGQWREAFRQLDICEPVFNERDLKRYRNVRHLRAAVLLRSGQYGAALQVYSDLRHSEMEHDAIAALSSDMAEAQLRLGNFREALRLVEPALEMRRATPDLLARSLLTKGRALSVAGDHQSAIATLKRASTIFSAESQYDDELVAELAIVSALLAESPSASVKDRLREAYQVAKVLDRNQPLRSGNRRMEMWRDLWERATRGEVTASQLDNAAEYLRTLRRHDSGPYRPLQ